MLLSNIFKKSVIIGENHSAVSPKKFVIENMQYFQANGFQVIFMEHIGQEYQPFLDKFLQSGVMPQELEKKLRDLDDGHLEDMNAPYGFLTIVQNAQKSGIAVLALEKSEKEYKNYPSGRDRIIRFNTQAKEYISRTPDVKFIAFVGTAHVNNSYKNTIEGISSLPNTNNIIISDAGGSELFFDKKQEFQASFEEPKLFYHSSDYYDESFLSEPSVLQCMKNKAESDFLTPSTYYASTLLILDQELPLNIETLDARLSELPDCKFNDHELFLRKIITIKRDDFARILQQERDELDSKKGELDYSSPVTQYPPITASYERPAKVAAASSGEPEKKIRKLSLEYSQLSENSHDKTQ